MMRGVKNWQHASIRYSQERNAVEAILRDRLAEEGINHGWLESCGASAFCTILEGLGVLEPAQYFRFPNGDTLQMDDAVMLWMHDPAHGAVGVMENRRGDSYLAAARVFGCKARYIDPFSLRNVVGELWRGHGVMLHLNNPGHWIAVVAGSMEELVYMDSWGSRPGLKNSGVHEIMEPQEFYANVREFAISISG